MHRRVDIDASQMTVKFYLARYRCGHFGRSVYECALCVFVGIAVDQQRRALKRERLVLWM